MNLRTCVLLVVLVFVPTRTAVGQTSSLRYHSRRVATTQPHMASTTSQLTQGPSGWQRRPLSPSTETLHRTSMIAVVPTPPKTFKVHDLLTIVVREQKKYEADATADSKKDASIDAALDSFFRIHGGKWKQQAFGGGKPEIKGKFAGEIKYDGKSEREDKFTTRITAEVIDVKPNGNLIVEATARIQNDEEVQVMTLTGTCRSLDVTPDNTVLSSQLADKDIVVTHDGAVRDATERGLIPRLLDKFKLF